MKEEDILKLGFKRSKAYMPNGMEKYGYRHYEINMPSINRYLYLEVNGDRIQIQTIGVADNNVKEVSSSAQIVAYIFEESFKAGEQNFKNKINALLK